MRCALTYSTSKSKTVGSDAFSVSHSLELALLLLLSWPAKRMLATRQLAMAVRDLLPFPAAVCDASHAMETAGIAAPALITHVSACYSPV